MILIRSLLYQAWFYGAMAVIALGYLPAALLFPRVANAAARDWSRAALWGADKICGLRIEVRGREHIPKGPALVASKHMASLDALLPFALLEDPSIALKQELARTPIFGWYCQRAGMLVLDREGQSTTMRKMLREARGHIAKSQQLFIFPEGTRVDPGAAPDYKPGVAALYMFLDLPCTPLALNTGKFWPAHGIMRRPGTAIVEFLPPIEPGLSRDEFMKALEDRIESRSNQLLAGDAAPAQAPA